MPFGCYHRLPRAAWQSYKFTSLVYETPTTGLVTQPRDHRRLRQVLLPAGTITTTTELAGLPPCHWANDEPTLHRQTLPRYSNPDVPFCENRLHQHTHHNSRDRHPIIATARAELGPTSPTKPYYHLVVGYNGNLHLHNEPIINNTRDNTTNTAIKLKCFIFSIQVITFEEPSF